MEIRIRRRNFVKKIGYSQFFRIFSLRKALTTIDFRYYHHIRLSL